MTDPFKLLGLKRATATEAEVKAAYAALLKTTRPEDDRAAFMALRDAFTNARAVAKNNDSRRVDQPDPEDIPDMPETAPQVEQPAQPIKWSFHKSIEWNVAHSPFGDLVKDTLDWMVAGGKDARTFVQQVAERLVSNEDISEARFCSELIEFIIAKGDTGYERDKVNEWEVFDLTRPDWLNDDLMRALADDLRLFKHKPSESYAARSYNVVLALFEPVLGPDKIPDSPPEALDAAGLFADEQNAHNPDEHGSHFDRSEMVWKDMSPVGKAMRDFEAAVTQPTWDLTERIKAILERDELQAIDEFQILDNRLRAFIIDATGFHSQDRKRVSPRWLSRNLLVLLNDTFGWSRHYGRYGWERQQFDWLHKLMGQQRIVKPPKREFRQAPQNDRQVYYGRSQQREPFRWLVTFLYTNPLWVLLGYFGYRVVQVLYRLAV